MQGHGRTWGYHAKVSGPHWRRNPVFARAQPHQLGSWIGASAANIDPTCDRELRHVGRCTERRPRRSSSRIPNTLTCDSDPLSTDYVSSNTTPYSLGAPDSASTPSLSPSIIRRLNESQLARRSYTTSVWLWASSSSVQPVRSSSAQAVMTVSRASIRYASFDSTHA